MALTSTDPFTGFPPDALGFLRALAVHQSRDWFQAHRDVFDATLHAPMVAFVDAVSVELAARKVPLQGAGARSLFRMNRDVRFSRDKSPYKTNLGAVLTRDGNKKGLGLLYLHVDPKGSFVAAGVYLPEADELKRIRARICEEPRAFRAARARLTKAKLSFGEEFALKRLPRGFEAVEAEDLQEAVKLKSLVVSRAIPEAGLTKGRALVKTAADLAEAALPLLEFCWAAARR